MCYVFKRAINLLTTSLQKAHTYKQYTKTKQYVYHVNLDTRSYFNLNLSNLISIGTKLELVRHIKTNTVLALLFTQ